MTFKKTLPVRRLISTLLYLCSASLFIANLAYTGAAGFSAIDIALVIVGVTMWVLGGVHSTYRRVKALKPEESVSAEDARQPTIRGSTHSAINAALFGTSAVFFIAGDAYNFNTPVQIRAPRLAGSILWLSMSHERKQENNPDFAIKPLGIRPEVYIFANESEYLAAGILYAAAIYLSSPIPALKAAGNSCWLLASTHETLRTLKDMVQVEVIEEEAALPSPAK
jgi:hypothetical protein